MEISLFATKKTELTTTLFPHHSELMSNDHNRSCVTCAVKQLGDESQSSTSCRCSIRARSSSLHRARLGILLGESIVSSDHNMRYFEGFNGVWRLTEKMSNNNWLASFFDCEQLDGVNHSCKSNQQE